MQYSGDPFSGRRAIPQGVPRKYTRSRAPTSVDSNVSVGDLWCDATNKVAYICVGKNSGVASWTTLSSNLDYQESVLKQTAIGGATETEGNRYLCNSTGGGWTDTYIYEWLSGAWQATTPSEGMVVFDENTSSALIYYSSAWNAWTTGISTIAAATDTAITTPGVAEVLLYDNVTSDWTNVLFTGDMATTKAGVTTVSNLTFGSDAQGDIAVRGAAGYARLSAKTDKQILIGDGTDLTSVPITGDIAITNLGAVTVTGITVGSDAQGDVYIRGAAGLERLAAGVAGQALVTLGAGVNPYWGAPNVANATSIANGATLSDAGVLDAVLSFTTQTSSSPTLTVPDFAGVSDTFVFTTLAQTLANKTLTAPDINGGTADSLTGFSLRSSGAAFDLEFDTAEVLTASKKISWDVGDTDRSITLGGNIALGGALTTLDAWTQTGAHTIGITTTGATTIILPTTGTLITLAGSETLTNKILTAPDINGGTADSLTGFSIRSSGAAFDLEQDTAEVLTGDKKISWDVGDTDRAITLGGDIALGGTLTTLGAWTQTGAHTIGITTTGNTALTLPTAGLVTATTAAGTAGQVIIGATGATGEFATIGHSGGTLTSTAGVNTLNIDTASSMIQTTTVEISNAQLKALNGTPIELVAAPGANKYIDFLGAVIGLNFVSTAMDDPTGDGDIQIRYDAGTVVSLTLEAAGFIDAAANAARTCKPLATDVAMATTKLELYNNAAEYTGAGGGDSTLTVVVNYRILDLS